MRAVIVMMAVLVGCDGAVEEPVVEAAPEVAPAPAPPVAKEAPRPDPSQEVVGREAGELAVKRWVQGSAAMGDGDATLLVFFEAWCPHCKKELPRSQAVYDELHGEGLSVVGLTQRNRGVTEDQLDALLADKGVEFPVGEIDPALARHFAVRGIPAAALVKDGVVVWRGHPARLTQEQLRGYLAGGS